MIARPKCFFLWGRCICLYFSVINVSSVIVTCRTTYLQPGGSSEPWNHTMKIVEFKTHQKEIFQFYEEKIYQITKHEKSFRLHSDKLGSRFGNLQIKGVGVLKK